MDDDDSDFIELDGKDIELLQHLVAAEIETVADLIRLFWLEDVGPTEQWPVQFVQEFMFRLDGYTAMSTINMADDGGEPNGLCCCLWWRDGQVLLPRGVWVCWMGLGGEYEEHWLGDQNVSEQMRDAAAWTREMMDTLRKSAFNDLFGPN